MSQRVLIVGVSESGKSTLARRLVKMAGLPYHVFDPIGAQWDGAASVSSDFAIFSSEVLADTRPRVAVIDEAGDVFGVGQRENHWLFTRGRHSAILPVAIAQRMSMIAPNVRTNATDLYLFRSSTRDCQTLADDYADDTLLLAAELEQGEFIHSRWAGGRRVSSRHKLF